MLYRLLDYLASFFGLVVLSPILIPFFIVTALQDWHSPFYVASRVGIDGKLFLMVKLRSMLVDADKLGVDSTAANDSRITPIGHFVRRYKLDEFTQLWNVLIGQMSLVGPRPNIERETRLYTEEEKRLLSIRPGITDFSSIVFADEADILEGHADPDLVYNQLIRPWKSRLSLFYIDNRNILLAIKLIYLTFLSMISRSRALYRVSEELRRRGAPTELVQIALRETALIPHPPLGAKDIVRSRIVD
jgi:lipopolysaccharide/colanic/teichoic acid biosynthesis glycosyltransferase